MKIVLLIFFFCTFEILSKDCAAAFVQYFDENGKIHYVNTDYAKVPKKYLGQVEDQLKQLEKPVEPETPASPLPAVPQAQPETHPNTDQLVHENARPTIPITDQNRLKRFSQILNESIVNNYFPPSVNFSTGIITYTNQSGEKISVTPENLSSVPEAYLPQIDAQIINLEKFANINQSRSPQEGSPQVEVFTAENCQDCNRLRTLLEIHKIPYLNYDVKLTSQGQLYYRTQSHVALPVTRVGKIIIHGLNIGEIKNALNAQGSMAATAPQASSALDQSQKNTINK